MLTRPVGRLCLLHIPKTSGTSAALYLQSQFEALEVCPARYAEDFLACSPAELGRYRLFHAECGASVLGLLPPATAMVTFLREPLARAFSHWGYIQRLPEHRLHEQLQDDHGTFDHFVTSAPSNPVARLLAAPEGEPPVGLWDPAPSAWDDAELHDRAVARLEACAVVGLAEHHDESIALLAHHFGWAPPRLQPLTNAAPPDTRFEPSDRARAVFAERNPVDIELYLAATALFDRRRRMIDNTTRAATYDDRVAAVTAPLEHRLVVDLCRPILGSGWLQVIDTPLGRMRPLGVGDATVDVPVRLGRFTRLEVTCPAVSSIEALECLEIDVNGEVVPFALQPEPSGVTLRAVMPPPRDDDRFTRITFRTRGGVAVPPNHTGAVSNLEATLGISRLDLFPYDPRALRISAQASPDDAPPERASGVLSRSSPTWVFDADLQRRLDEHDLWENVQSLQRDGFVVVPDVVPPETVGRARDLICQMAGGSTLRTRRSDVLMPLWLDPLFVELLLHPVQLALADAVCGKGMLDAQTGLVRDRTSNPQALHAENAAWLPAPYPDHHYVVSLMLTCDDFDEVSGGTCFVPGSHLTRRDPSAEESVPMAGAVTPQAPSGSLIVWLGGTWHGARQRTTEGERVSLLTIFTRPSLRPTMDVRSQSGPSVTSDELRIRLRQMDPFEHESHHTADPTAMLRWIRNIPGPDAITCGWDETVVIADPHLT